jgi:hypothetical protein
VKGKPLDERFSPMLSNFVFEVFFLWKSNFGFITFYQAEKKHPNSLEFVEEEK